MAAEWEPIDLDLSVPSAARMYDYYLGGKNHFEVDRARAEQVIEALPQVRDIARANRAFLGAAVRSAAEAGVAQFIDLGAGLPTQGHVHEVARPIRPETRVVYVDLDPIACAHARALLPDDATAVVSADIRTPRRVLDDPEVGRLIDWRQPVMLLLISVLHFISDDEDPAGIIGAFAEKMAPGSRLALTVASGPGPDTPTGGDERIDQMTNAYKGSGTSVGGLRTRAQIASYFVGFEIMEPGMVDVRDWPNPAGGSSSDSMVRLLAAVGERVR